MNEIKRPVLRYHGGKFLLAPWIISHFPKHKVYVDLFGGGGSILMRKPRSFAEVYNDKWDTVVNVFKVLRDPDQADRLESLIRLTPFSRSEFEQCGELEISKIADPVERARLTIFRSFAGFGSASTNAKYSTGFRANNNRAGTTPAHDWQNYPKHIAVFTERLKGVVIENKDYRSIIDQQDAETTLFYADPPYVHETRNMKRRNAAYEFEFTDDDHRAMASAFSSMKGMVVISGYRCDLYDELFSGDQYTRFEKLALADGARKRVECLWLNERAAKMINKKLF